MADLWMWQSQADYDEWLNELLVNTPDSYDDDASAESIVTDYVRDIEGLVGWLLDAEYIVIDSTADEVVIEDRHVPDQFWRLVKSYVERRLPDVEHDGDVLSLGPVPWQEPAR